MRHLSVILSLVAGIWFMPSCASLSIVNSVRMNIRIRNESTGGIDVSYRNNDGIRRTERVLPGQLAHGFDSVVWVKLPRGEIKVMVMQFMNEEANRFRRTKIDHVFDGVTDVIFEVDVDDQGQTWGRSKDGRRLPVKSSSS